MSILPEVQPLNLNESNPSTRRSSEEISQTRERILIEHGDYQVSQTMTSSQSLNQEHTLQHQKSARRQAVKDMMNESDAEFTYLHQKAAVKDCIFDTKNRADKKQQ